MAINQLNVPTLWFWPNVDAGADGTSAGIRSFREKNELTNVHFFKNMEGADFLVFVPATIAQTQSFALRALIDFYKVASKRYLIIEIEG